MIGRFAPSPTGPLHFGSLVAALASYLEVKSIKNSQGLWLVRMEDLDKPRETKGAADDILRTLEAFGFAWDGAIMYQSQRTEAYEDALEKLKANTYSCTCSRREIADSALQGIDGLIYSGICRAKANLNINQQHAIRIKVLDRNISFNDAIQGNISQNLARDIGDFVLKRADNIFAYQLAAVVDDDAQAVTHIVRGADLLNSTPRQIYLQQLLGYAQTDYMHLPIAINSQGEKLSKQTLANPIVAKIAPELIVKALQFLGQSPPHQLLSSSVDEIFAWAKLNWQGALVPKTNSLGSDC